MCLDSYPVRSGMIESAAKQPKARFCGSGIHWSQPGAERLCPVQSAIHSHRFDKMNDLPTINPKMKYTHHVTGY
jgi:hypothetical protein